MKRLIFPCDGQWTQQILAHNVKREVTPLLLSLSNPCMHRACLLKIKPAICLVSGEESTKDFSLMLIWKYSLVLIGMTRLNLTTHPNYL